MYKTKLGNKILAFRAKNDLTQMEFAEMCNISIGTVCNIENGKSYPNKRNEIKILSVINGKKADEIVNKF